MKKLSGKIKLVIKKVLSLFQFKYNNARPIKMEIEKIPDKNIINGMKKSLKNSESLLNEALLLQSHKNFARAYTLCQFSLEEQGKVQILFELWIKRINGNQIDYEQMNKNFINHKTKTKISIDTEITFWETMKERTGYDWIDKIIDDREKLRLQISTFNNLKNESLYVSIKNDDFQSPEEVIGEEEYKNIFSDAYMRLGFSKNFVLAVEEHINKIAKLIKDDDENNNS